MKNESVISKEKKLKKKTLLKEGVVMKKYQMK